MRKLKPEYRKLANPTQFERFLDGDGALTGRDHTAQRFDYDWHAHELTFAPHFRGHVLMQTTAYRSTRDHRRAAQHDPSFVACGAGVEISVSGLAQANRNRPLEPLVVMLQRVVDAVASLPHRHLRALDTQTWRGIVDLLHRTDLFDATTLTLPPKVRAWAKGTTDESAALKLQLRIDGKSGKFKTGNV